MSPYHESVLCEEVMQFLLTDKQGVYVDATLGGGGHAERICARLGTDGRLVGFDADGDAISATRERLEPFAGQVTLLHANFRHLQRELEALDIHQVAGVLFDLGVSSYQLDTGEKGFSFRVAERLDMRMDRRQGTSAWDVVNTYSQERLTEILRTYGEERAARRIGRAIVAARPVETTGELSGAVERCVGTHFVTKSLARVFQAIRMEVNDELMNLRQALEAIPAVLAPGGRCVVISYHSLEDRVVKEFFRAEASSHIPSGHKYVPDEVRTPRLQILTKKPLTASDEERARNPRARSAKLRAAQRTAL